MLTSIEHRTGNSFLIKEPTIINEGERFIASILISSGKIEKIIPQGYPLPKTDIIIDGKGKFLIPGVIDDQVHFREPGLTWKEDIEYGSKAAVAGGITSFMEMPNTNPQTLTIDLLEKKFSRAKEVSPANYSFYFGASNNNFEELLKVNPKEVCGVKLFMGSSTGNMLVDNPEMLDKIFAESPTLIATHCEDEPTIKANTELAHKNYGKNPPFSIHPEIRSEKACFLSSQKAVSLAKEHNTRLHILHLSTAKELSLFENNTPLEEKKITTEVCVHHLWFTNEDYDRLGSLMKWNPAIKKKSDRDALREALISGKLDVVATDHAPHTLEEKTNSYFKAPSGGPLVQHSLLLMLEMAKNGIFTFEQIVEKMCHNPAKCFQIENRGFIRENFAADLVLFEEKEMQISKNNLLYKCGWSPFEGEVMHHQVVKTFVNGNLVFDNGTFPSNIKGERLTFNR